MLVRNEEFVQTSSGRDGKAAIYALNLTGHPTREGQRNAVSTKPTKVDVSG